MAIAQVMACTLAAVGYWLGLDVGTTFSAAGVCRDGRVEIVGLGNHASVVPSLLFLREDGSFLVGDAAARRGVGEPGRLARGFKRRFGDPTPVLLGGSPFSADGLTSRLVGWLVAAVAEREGRPADAVAVTCPANWGPFKTDLLVVALRAAGLEEVVLLSEPEAAAVFYASTERVEPGEVVAVYDLGGGTFDAAVMRKTVDGFELLGVPEGVERLGGVDFDEAVVSHVRGFLGDALSGLDLSDPAVVAALARLRGDCVEAKEALSADTEASIPVLLPSVQTEIRLTRAEFESMIRPTLVETTAALGRALRSAGVGAEELAAVLLVGGSSRIPLVGQLVAAELGRPVAIDVHPKHAVAEGAAIAAGRKLGVGDPSPPASGAPGEAPVVVRTPRPPGGSTDGTPEAARGGEQPEVPSPLAGTAASSTDGGMTGGSVVAPPSSSVPPPADGSSDTPRGRWSRRRLMVIGAGVVAVVVVLAVVGALLLKKKPSSSSPPRHAAQVPTFDVQLNATSIAAGGGSLWLGASSNPTVSRFDPASHQLTQTIRVGDARGDTWVAFGAGAVWAVNDAGTNAYRIDPATNSVTATYAVGRQPRGVIFAADAVWVAATMDGVVTRIDPATGATTQVHLRGQPTHLAYSSNTLWVTDPGNGDVARIDTVKNVALGDAKSGGCPDFVAADDAAVWVQDECKVSSIFKVDPASGAVVGTATVGRDAKGVVLSGGSVYVSNATDGTVSQVDVTTLKTSRVIVVGNSPAAMVVDNQALWVMNTSDSTLSRIAL